MNINPGLIDKALNAIPYPISRDDLIEEATQRNLPPQIVSVLEKLPNQTFNSAEDIKGVLRNMGGILKG